MQIVRDLDSDVYGVRRTLPPIRCHAHGPTVGAFRHAPHQSVFTGQGFQMSNTRKSIKPRSRYFQLARLKAKKMAYWEKSMCAVRCGKAMGISGSSRVKCWPATSSMTTCCGSSLHA